MTVRDTGLGLRRGKISPRRFSLMQKQGKSAWSTRTRSQENMVTPASGRRLAPPSSAPLNQNSLEALRMGS